MDAKVKVLAFAGSLRKDSFNKKLVRIAGEAARGAGAEVTFLDLKDLPLPVYDGDIEMEEGLPANAIKLKELLSAHNALLIATPEYNSSISGALKNAIDWASRPLEGEKMLHNFQGKVAGIMSASPGALGGLRGLVHVRAILENIGLVVVPNQIAIGKVFESMDADGSLKDKKQQGQVEKIGVDVVKLTAAMLSTTCELRLT